MKQIIGLIVTISLALAGCTPNATKEAANNPPSPLPEQETPSPVAGPPVEKPIGAPTAARPGERVEPGAKPKPTPPKQTRNEPVGGKPKPGDINSPEVEAKRDPLHVPQRKRQLREISKTAITVGDKTIRAHVANNDVARQEGLSWLTDKHLKTGECMLFVYREPATQSVTMKNTALALEVAFLAADGTVLSVHALTPKSETAVASKGKALFAVEMHKGELAKFGIKVGARVSIIEGLTSED